MADGQTGCSQGATYERVQRALEWPMMLLSLAFVGAMVLEDAGGVPPVWRDVGRIAQWAIWAAFAAEYVTLLCLARHRRLFLRTHLLDAAIIVFPALRVLRVIRLLRLLRLLRAIAAVLLTARHWRATHGGSRKAGLAMATAVCLLLIMVGAYVAYLVEGRTNEGFASYGTCVWWAVTTATTVGYGDVVPQTAGGRFLACVFMAVGITAFGLVSAAIAAYFVEQDSRDEWRALEARLDDVTQALRELQTRMPEPQEVHDEPDDGG